ncbi:DNA cytosine methyltransferase [Alteromonas australica]|uniref:DNA cytosine methyltransferase n=1 Tax=Alteromonas australica TaxID=589873 RepID=UPI00248FBB7F|nr:DNA cytosine methyltransferase [Alteromonas australica]|tara:strand:+ start:484 stop:1902 length:1419 start_codon:yes stop_codon:yes gene_type:complete
MDTIFATLGTNKGSLRLYLQGEHLARNEFAKGVRYDRLLNDETGKIVLRRSDYGQYIVSGKNKKSSDTPIPVIDINTNELAAICDEGERLKITLSEGVIEISTHHLEVNRRIREAHFNMAMKKRHFTKGVFCVGIGMATLAMQQGFHAQGFTSETSWVVDRDLSYLNVFMRQNPACSTNTQVHCAKLEELEPADLTPVNVCQFSLDCAAHSKSGKSKNGFSVAEQHEGTTGAYGLLKSLERINAGVYISENVEEAMNSTTYMLIKSTLQHLGYIIYETVLDSTQSGCIENRPRYWMLAISKGLAFNLDVTIPHYPRTFETLGELMEDIDDDSEMWSENTYLKEKAIRDAKAGKGFKRQLVDESTTQIGVINRHYAKRQSTPPMIVRADGMERLFTVSEHAKIKGCTLSLIEGLGFTLGHEGLGQGIDMKQGQGISEFLIMAMTQVYTTPVIETKPKSESIPSQASLFDSLLV